MIPTVRLLWDRSLRLWRGLTGREFQALIRRHPKRLGQLFDVDQRDIAFTTLHLLDVTPIQSALKCQRFLSESYQFLGCAVWLVAWKQISEATPEALTKQFDRIKPDVLLTHLNPVQGRFGDTEAAGEVSLWSVAT